MPKSATRTRKSWSRIEVEAVVADYFHMLMLELAGQQYNKTAHRRALLTGLNGRSEGSVELKHQNISAILIELGAPWINGYKPMSNYQGLLLDVVGSRVTRDRRFDEVASVAVEQPAIAPLSADYEGLVVEAPSIRGGKIRDVRPFVPRKMSIKKDYLAIECRNRSLGKAGEEFVVQYERHRLHELGAKKLVDRVEHVSQTKGDGLGFDVLSFETNGKEKLIEVKTTAFGREAPFYVSRSELELSKAEPDQFHLYRLFEFRQQPRMYSLAGPVAKHCLLDPVSYLARFT